jgi:rubrerythrin
MNDLISRQAAIDEIEYELEMINSALDSITLDFNVRERLRQRRGEAREMLNSIQQLPSVQPERKKGKWIIPSRNPEIVNKELFCDCSFCGFTTMDETNFCPHCGAEMEVE